MKIIFICLLILYSYNCASSQDSTIRLQDVSISHTVSYIYTEILDYPYVMHPDVINDDRKISFYFTDDTFGVSKSLKYTLENLGYEIISKEGFDYIGPFEDSVKEVGIYKIYRTRYRDPSYILSVISSSKNVIGNRSKSGSFNRDSKKVMEGSNKYKKGKKKEVSKVAINYTVSGDMIFIKGTESEIKEKLKLIEAIDIPPSVVVATAYVYEVSVKKGDGSGVSIVSELLSNKFSLAINPVNIAGNFMASLTGISGFNIIVDFLDTNSSIELITNPILSVTSGNTARFSVGKEVPVLSGRSIEDGITSYNVNYMESGVIFEILPKVYKDNVSITIRQQISDFVVTTSGVNSSPTLMKKELSTSVDISPGDIIILSGLSEKKETEKIESIPFFGNLLDKAENNYISTDIVLFLKVDVVDRNEEDI